MISCIDGTGTEKTWQDDRTLVSFPGIVGQGLKLQYPLQGTLDNNRRNRSGAVGIMQIKPSIAARENDWDGLYG